MLLSIGFRELYVTDTTPIIKMQSALNHIKRVFSVFLAVILITISLSITSQQSAIAFPFFNFTLTKQLDKILPSKQMVSDAKRFLEATPEKVCNAYFDKLDGIDSKWAAIEEGVVSTIVLTEAVKAASTAGAGQLAEYAGIASVVSKIGLGSFTKIIAGMMGKSVVGAAATAVVTSAVGGPVVMGTILVGGTVSTAYGIYELGNFTVDKLGSWAENYCVSQSTYKRIRVKSSVSSLTLHPSLLKWKSASPKKQKTKNFESD